MSCIRRVILDTSTLVSSALRQGSIPDQALTKAFREFDLCFSLQTLEELTIVMGREKFDRYLDPELRRAFVEVIRSRAYMFAVPDLDTNAIGPSCRDPKDNKFLALALVSESHLLVSSDADLLVLHPWRGMPIVTPASFLG